MASEDRMQGEGNKEADRRYREGVRETVKSTTEEERAEKARKADSEKNAKLDSDAD